MAVCLRTHKPGCWPPASPWFEHFLYLRKQSLPFCHLTLQWQMTCMGRCTCTYKAHAHPAHISPHTHAAHRKPRPEALIGLNTNNICCAHFSASVSSLYSDRTKWAQICLNNLCFSFSEFRDPVITSPCKRKLVSPILSTEASQLFLWSFLLIIH